VALPAPAQFMRYAGGKLWITLLGMDAIARVDTRIGNPVTVSVGRSPIQTVLAGGKLFVTSRDDHTVQVLSPRGRMRPLAEPITVGQNPYAIVADKRSLWVTGLGDDTLTRIDYRR
jgi:DNA-binding beta-propeller fold protein YncE